MENHHFNRSISHTWLFSVAMLVYWRVYEVTPWNLWFDGFHNNHPKRERQATVGHVGTSCFDGLTTAQNRETAQSWLGVRGIIDRNW